MWRELPGWRILLKPFAIFLLGYGFLLPGVVGAPIDGWPLNPLELILFVSFLAPLVITGWTKNTKLILVILSLLLCLSGMRLIGSVTIPSGWSVCLKRELAREPLKTLCESTGEQPSGERSYLRPEINFERLHFPLFFMNQPEFGYSQSEHNRYNLPYSAKIEGYLFAGEKDSVTVKTTIPAVSIQVNETQVTQPLAKEVKYELKPRQLNYVAITYGVSYEYENELYINSTAQSYSTGVGSQRAKLFVPYYIFLTMILVSLALILAYSVIVTLRTYSKSLQKSISVLILSAVTVLAVSPSDGFLFIGWVLFLLIIGWYALLAKADERIIFTKWSCVILLLLSIGFITRLHSYGEMIIWPGGADTFTHTNHARSVLMADSIRDVLVGGENQVYYYQPLYRYFAALVHKITGESYWGIYVFQTYLSALLVYFGVVVLGNRVGRASAATFSILMLVFSGIFIDSSLFTLSQKFYQQSLGIPVYLLGILVFLQVIGREFNSIYTKALLVVAGGLLGIAAMTRSDILPSLPFVILALYLWDRSHKKSTAAQRIGLVILGLMLPIIAVALRNYYVAGEFSVLTTSTLVNLLPVFQPIFNYTVRGPSEEGGVSVLLRIIAEYRNNLGTLAHILIENVNKNIIYQVVPLGRVILWFLVAVISVIFIAFIPRKEKGVVCALIVGFIALLGTMSFFWLHLEYGMLVVFDVLIILIASIIMGLIFKDNISILVVPFDRLRNKLQRLLD